MLTQSSQGQWELPDIWAADILQAPGMDGFNWNMHNFFPGGV
jgi:hypothetical protein